MAGEAVPPLPAQGGSLPILRARFALPFLALLLAAMALAAPVNHDEDQYVAAATLASHAVLYRDFLSLQTPLHAWVFAPLALIPGWAFLAMRLATALLAGGTLALVHALQRALGVERRAALLATALLACCTAFQVGASVVRNDMLPALLMTLGLAALLRLSGWRGAALAGLCVGLSISAKLSYAPFAPALCLALLLPGDAPFRQRLGTATMAGGSVLAGMLPIFLYWIWAPEAFWWGVVGFARTAPQAYYAGTGLGFWLTPLGKVARLLLVALEGPALLALLLRLAWRGRTRTDRGIDLFLIAGLVAAFLPTPSWRQYLLPALPPLFVGLGLAWRRPPRLLITLLALFTLVGLARPARDMVTAAGDGWPAFLVERHAHALGRALDQAGVSGPVATTSVHAVLDSGHAFDPRFAPGAFVLRNHHLLDAAKAARLHVLTAETLAPAFDRVPPQAILTGYEIPSDMFPVRQDEALRDYALSHAYVLHRAPGDDGELFLAPSKPWSR